MSQGSTSQASVKEYVVRIPKVTKKRFNMMRFSADHGSDFFKSWTQCKMERENNMKEFKNDEEIPKFGAGSEFGRDQKEEARRKRYGINIKKYRSEDQPWLLNLGGKTGKRFKGIRDGGVAENVSWFVFMQGKDGAFEAYPVEEWYNFHPINRYKALSAEEAEEEFVKRDKIMNYFQIMYEKKFKKDSTEGDEDEGKKKGSQKSLMLSEMDDWFSDDDDEDRNGDDDDDGESETKKKKKKKKKGAPKKKAGGKKRRNVEADSDGSYEEESDEYNEGAEHDYISGDSSDSDQENEEVARNELKGVDQDDALRKLLASDDEDEEENKEDNEEDEDEENGKDDENPQKEKKKKKKKKKDKSAEKESEDSSDTSSEEPKPKDNVDPEKKKAVNDLKRKVKENPLEMQPAPKKSKMEPSSSNPGGSSSSSAGAPTAGPLEMQPPPKKPKMESFSSNSGGSLSIAGAATAGDSMEDAIRKYLMRKPMTTTELLKNFKKKKDMSSEQLVTTIAQVLKKVNPVKRVIKGKMYLSLKPS